MSGRVPHFEATGLEVAFVVGALVHGLDKAETERDIEQLGALLDRAIAGLADPLSEENCEHIARIRERKGLPA